MSDKEIFDISGPKELPAVPDWSNFRQQISVAASLVRGVYVLERDCLNKREGREALASRWWEDFGFELSKKLIDGSTIFGAVYHHKHNHHHHPPRCVVAFRGTNTKNMAEFIKDSKLNFRLWRYALHETPRFQKALKAVYDSVKNFGVKNVWITGHSLGAAIALAAGKNMVKSDGGDDLYLLKAFLFNPPFVGWTNRFTRELVGALAAAKKFDDEAAFAAWSRWHPHLFVNSDDPLCSKYIKYFEGKRRMPAAQHTFRGLFLGVESTHLIPSALLTVNHTSANIKDAHGIYQWWRADFRLLKTHIYTFNPNEQFSKEEVAVSCEDDTGYHPSPWTLNRPH